MGLLFATFTAIYNLTLFLKFLIIKNG